MPRIADLKKAIVDALGDQLSNSSISNRRGEEEIEKLSTQHGYYQALAKVAIDLTSDKRRILVSISIFAIWLLDECFQEPPPRFFTQAERKKILALLKRRLKNERSPRVRLELEKMINKYHSSSFNSYGSRERSRIGFCSQREMQSSQIYEVPQNVRRIESDQSFKQEIKQSIKEGIKEGIEEGIKHGIKQCMSEVMREVDKRIDDRINDKFEELKMRLDRIERHS